MIKLSMNRYYFTKEELAKKLGIVGEIEFVHNDPNNTKQVIIETKEKE